MGQPRRLIGVDGGSSSLRAVASDGRRHTAAGGTNLHEDPEDVVVARLRAVGEALGRADGVCVGTAGIDAPGDAERFTAVFARAFPGATLEVVSDVTVIAACADEPLRVCVIAGTGSNVYAVGPGGEAWVGGLDLPLTDWGSAASIGHAALVRGVREANGLDPVALGPALYARHRLRFPEDWRSLKTVRAAATKAGLGALARDVSTWASAGVAAAQALLDDAGDELGDAIEAALRRVDGPGDARLLLVGSVLEHAPGVRARVEARWARLRPGSPVGFADAAFGALRRAASFEDLSVPSFLTSS